MLDISFFYIVIFVFFIYIDRKNNTLQIGFTKKNGVTKRFSSEDFVPKIRIDPSLSEQVITGNPESANLDVVPPGAFLVDIPGVAHRNVIGMIDYRVVEITT